MEKLTADEAYECLRQGNQRFRDGVSRGAGRDEARRRMLARRQAPFAAILCCADSRVAPELVFDTGIGELFVVRVAGNVANTATVASIEFAVASLDTKLLVVMAHENCGAVTAAVEGGAASPALEHLLEHIRPAVDAGSERAVDVVARRNASMSAQRLVDSSRIIHDAVDGGGVRVVTAFYRTGTGAVELI